MPLNKLFLIIIYIFNYKFDNEDEKEFNTIYIIAKLLISAIIIVMPIILLIITLIKLDNIIKKNKQYWWTKDKYNYLNTRYMYLNKFYNLYGIIFSSDILLYLGCSISFIIISIILFVNVKFKKLIDNDKCIDFKKIFYYNSTIFLVIFLIIIFLSLNHTKYNRVYKYNKILTIFI